MVALPFLTHYLYPASIEESHQNSVLRYALRLLIPFVVLERDLERLCRANSGMCD